MSLTYQRTLVLAMLDSLRRHDLDAYQRIACNPHTPASTITAALYLAGRVNHV